MQIFRKTYKAKVVLLIGFFVLGLSLDPLIPIKHKHIHEKSVLFEDAPLVRLSGILNYHTFAGPPNYESIAEGDTEESAWVLELDKESSERMWSLPITKFTREHFPDVMGDDWVQLVKDRSDQEMSNLHGKVSVKGFLGPWETAHVHTPFLLEVVNIAHEK